MLVQPYALSMMSTLWSYPRSICFWYVLYAYAYAYASSIRTFQTLMRWVPIVSIVVSSFLKIVLLRNTDYRKLTPLSIIHVASCSSLEQLALLLSVAAVLSCYPPTRHYVSKHCRIKSKMYLSLVFPELIRVAAIMLQIFDAEPVLMLLIAAIMFSIQSIAFRCLITLQSKHYILGAVIVLSSKLLVKYCFYSFDDIWRLGLFM